MIVREDSELLSAFAEVALGAQGWDVPLALLRAQMQADRVTLFGETDAWDCTGTTPPARPTCFAALRPSRVYGAEEMADRADPFDPDFTQGDTRVIATSTPRLWLWLSRARGQFRAADSARLSSVMPHLAQAMVVTSDRVRLTHALDHAAALQWRAGLALLDASGPDAIAARMLDEAHLTPAMAMVAPGVSRALPGAISAYGLPDGTILLRATRDLPPPDRLARALGLTLSEARLAHALGQGQTLPDATAALGLTRETGRSYAKQIYAKTGANGQSALIRLLWSSAIAFG